MAEKNETDTPREPPEDVKEKQDPDYDESAFRRALDKVLRRDLRRT